VYTTHIIYIYIINIINLENTFIVNTLL
jgi:hypothetical protein